jgi:hypothetical protein
VRNSKAEELSSINPQGSPNLIGLRRKAIKLRP